MKVLNRYEYLKYILELLFGLDDKIISGFVVQKRFVTVHSLANKITGAVLFVLPLTLSLIDLSYSAIFVCLAATFAAIQEGHIIRSQ